MKENMKKNRRGHKRQNKSTYRSFSGIAILMITLAVIAGFIFTDSFQAMAQADSKTEEQFYKSITIEKGDTLWNIAEEYMGNNYESVEEYVCVLKKMNNLKSDKIFFGDKLVVVYSADL